VYCRDAGYPLIGIGIPKTVDNDLHGTDHTPGYGSAARYMALCVQQAGRLARDMQRVDRFVVFQTIGRDAGWLAASTALAKKRPADAPHLIYMPERRVNRSQLLDDVRAIVDRVGWCFIVIGEGSVWEDGTLVSASTGEDEFSNVEFGAMGGASAAINVHALIARETGYRGEFQITESLPMCAIDRASGVDLDEAYRCGAVAVELARAGRSGVMVSIQRAPGSTYAVSFAATALPDVAARAKRLPSDYINAAGNGVTDAFFEYASPLVGDFPSYSVLGEQ
jgi:6-phosphofructokinase 1